MMDRQGAQSRHQGSVLRTGEASNVESAVEADVREIGKRGLLVSQVVIPWPEECIDREVI
jgi:microcompartment protein CcmL/EutN